MLIASGHHQFVFVYLRVIITQIYKKKINKQTFCDKKTKIHLIS